MVSAGIDFLGIEDSCQCRKSWTIGVDSFLGARDAEWHCVSLRDTGALLTDLEIHYVDFT